MIARQRKIYFGGVCVIILSGILFPFWRGTTYNEDFPAREIRRIFNPNFRRPSPSLQDRLRFRTWSRAGMFGLDGTNDLVFNIAPIWNPPTKADASLRWPWQRVSEESRMYVEIDLPRLLFFWSTELIVLGLFVGGFGWNYPDGNDDMVLLVSRPVTLGSIVGWILGTLLPFVNYECTDSLIIGLYLFPILVGLVASLARRSWASPAKLKKV